MFDLVGDKGPLLPFEILRREASQDGEIWHVRCKQCVEEVAMDMSAPQVGVDAEHTCPRGEKWLLQIGPPRTGTDLLKSVKDVPAPSEEFHPRHPSQPN